MSKEDFKELDMFNHVIKLGITNEYRFQATVYVRIKWDGKRLSLTGVEGPKSNGDAVGSCGQIRPNIAIHEHGADVTERLLKVWDRWHLNDMRPGCEHQRKLGWGEKRIDESKPKNSYGIHFDGQKQPSWNLLGWVREDEHPNGLLCKACPECGYKYGTEWKTENVPSSVLEFLKGTPETTDNPPWV